MAKKKTANFENVVNDSFKDGYDSDPEVIQEEADAESRENPVDKPRKRSLSPEVAKSFYSNLDKDGFESAIKTLSPDDQESLLLKLKDRDEEITNKLFGRKGRSTYYLTDLHRACIEEAAREEDIKINDVVIAALESFFTEDIVTAAKERIVSMSVKKLSREISNT